jgi:hypothetical protein
MKTKSKKPNELSISFEDIQKKIEILDKVERIKIDKIYTLKHLLESITVDETKTTIGSEQTYLKTFNVDEEELIKNKLLQLINNF